MTYPTPVDPSGAEGAQSVYPMPEWSPGMPIYQAYPGAEFAQPVNIVGPGQGGQPVYLLGGLPFDAGRHAREQAEGAHYMDQQARQARPRPQAPQPEPEPRQAAPTRMPASPAQLLARQAAFEARQRENADRAQRERAARLTELRGQADARRAEIVRVPRLKGLASLIMRGWLIPPPP